MSDRIVIVNLANETRFIAGDPVLDPDEGVLAIQFSDGTSRIFNWAHVVDFYYMTEEETKEYLRDYDDN